MSDAASTAAMAPSDAWAKFTIWLARYTSTMPIAVSADSEPVTSPRNSTAGGAGQRTNSITSRPRAPLAVTASSRRSSWLKRPSPDV